MELFIFSQHEEPLAVISEDTGLIETHYRIEVNGLPDEPFTFTLKSEHPYAKHVKEENKVVFKDHEGDWRLMTIKEVDDSNDSNGPTTIATCEPTFAAELNDHIVVERRFVEQTADVALAAAVQGTRWQSIVEVELGRATTNFYYISSVGAIWKVIDTWGGEFKDVVEFNVKNNNITGCYVKIIQRLGTEQGQRFEIDHNTTEIGRTVNSYPKTALYGRGASLEIEDEEGELTGGYTRYIDFGDVEWRTSRGDPVNKPLGQKWVGDPEALAAYGYETGDKHRYGIFSNQDYEDPADLLQATWEALQDAKKPEVNYKLSVELFDKKVSLGDTCQAIDRKFARPIEIQARIIAMEYDLMDIEGTMVVEMGQFLDLGDNRIDDLEKEVENIRNRPPKQIIDEGSYPNIKPGTPVNLEAYGGMEVIQLYWDYASQIYVKHYEVYGSRTADFIPDSQHLLWRGNTSAFAHTVGTDEVWYYRIRAVNYHGTPSDWSVQVRGATHRVLTEDILWGPELAERMRELHRISDIIGENGVNFDQISQEAKDLINQQAKIYTDEEIQATREDVMRDLSEIADDLEYIDGQLVDKVNVGDVYTIADIDGMFENTVSITRYETDMDGVVQDLEHHETLISQNEQEILNRVTETIFNEEAGYLRQSIADVQIHADQIEQTVKNIEIGSRNLIQNSKGDTLDGWYPWGGVANVSISDYIGHTWIWARKPDTNSAMGVNTPPFQMKANKTYICSFLIRSRSNSGYDLNYLYLRQGRETITSVKGLPIVNMRTGFDGDIAGDGLRVWFTFSHNEDIENARLLLAIRDRPEGAGFVIREIKIAEGNMLTDWSPAPEDTDNRMTIAESRITQLSDDITFKVDVDSIVSEININREGIRLSGALIHLNGLSLIDEAIIQNAHIADGTIERAKLTRAIIGTAQIDDLAVTNAKIGNISADKLNAGAIRGIDVYGAKFRSSNGNNWMEIVGGDIHLEQSNGRYMDLGPTGLYGYNAGGSVRFQADSLLVTSRALGTATNNVYLAAQSGKEARVVDMTGLPSDGEISSYDYLPLRAQGIYAGFIENNAGSYGNNLYLRPRSGGEVRITGAGTTDAYYNLRVGNIYSNGLITRTDSMWMGVDSGLHVVNKSYAWGGGGDPIYRNIHGSNIYNTAMITRTANAYIGSDNELRVVNKGLGDIYRNVRAQSFFGNRIALSSHVNGIHFHVQPSPSGEVLITSRNDSSTYCTIRAASYPTGSSEKVKENIVKYENSALDILKNSVIYEYNRIGISCKRELGFIIERETPDEVLYDAESINGYSHSSLNTKAIQELDTKLNEEINWQRIEYRLLKNKVTKLEEEVQELREMVA